MGYEDNKARLAEDLLARRRAAAATAPVDARPLTYDPTPLAQLAPEPEAGYIRGAAASLVRGVAQIPVTGGRALEANPEADLTGAPRSFANRLGKTVADTAEGVRDAVVAPNYGTNELKRSVFGGVESLPGSVAYVAPSVAGAVIGEAVNPFGGGFAGAAAGSAATYPIMQKSTYQETYNALKKDQAAGRLKSGTTEQQIVDAATRAGHYEAAPEAATNIAEALLYTAPGVGAAAKVGRRLLSKATGKQLATNVAGTAAMEVPSEMATGYGQQEAVNRITANPRTTPTQAAIDSIGPTLVMSGIMGGGVTAGQHLEQRLGDLANKIESDATNRDAARAASPTPRAAALLAGVPASDTDNIALPAGLPDLLGARTNEIIDSENFTREHSTDLLARRKVAEARNAAAFDSANPVIPDAPAPAPVFEASGLDPEMAPAQQPSGAVDLASSLAAKQGEQPSNEQQEAYEAGTVAAFGQARARNASTDADYTQTTPDESHALFVDRHAADPVIWMQAMNSRGNINDAATRTNAHANRVSALARYDELVAAQAAPTAAPLNQDPMAGAPVSFGSEPAASTQQPEQAAAPQSALPAWVNSTPSHPLNATEEEALGNLTDTTNAEAIFGELGLAAEASKEQAAQVLGTTPSEAMAVVGRELLRRETPSIPVSFDTGAATPSPAVLQNISTIMERESGRVPTPEQVMARHNATFGPDVDPNDASIQMEQRAATNLNLWSSLRSQYPVISERIAAFDAQNTTSVVSTAPTSSMPDQYTGMVYTELRGLMAMREAQDPAMARSCYAFANDNATATASMQSIYRDALREFDFRQANPVANNPQNVLPPWADDNDPLEADAAAAYSELRTNPDLTTHVLAIRSDVVDELVSAGENPTRYDYAVAREVMRRFEAETTEAITGTPHVSYQEHDGTYSVMDPATRVITGVNFATRVAAAAFGRLMAAPANPVPGTAQQATAPGVSQAEQDAPRDVAAIVAGAPNHSTHEAFVEWVYGDNMSQQNVRSSIDDIYTGPLADRLSRSVTWPTSRAKTRLQILLTALQDEGYTSLSQVHTGHTPVRPPAPAAAATYSPEVVASVTSPLTPGQATDTAVLKGLANRVALSLAAGLYFQAETRRLWKGALEGVYYAVADKVDHFRYGTSTATTLQGIQDDLNAYQRSIGSDLEVELTPYSGGIKVRTRHARGRNQWFEAVYSTPSGSGAMADHSPNQREAGDGGAGYYAVHLAAKLMPQYRFQSSGMTQTNQNRRLEHAFSFLARYGAAGDTGDVHISAHSGSGNTQIMDGESPLGATATRVLKRTLDIYPELGKYTFNFRDGTIHDADNRRIPVAAIVAHARTNGALHDPVRHVSASGSPRQGFSESTFLRALITQQILRVAKADSRPGTRKLEAIMHAISANPGYSDLIFYNRTEGVKPKSELQAPALQKALVPITEALNGFIPINVIQTMAHLPGHHDGMPAFNAAYHNGAIYVVADQVESVAEAKKLILDHELRHAGLRQVLGKGMDTFLKQAWYAKTNEIRGFANGKGIDTSTTEGRLEAAEEYIVSLAQEAKNHPLLDRAIAKIRNLLRAVGIDLALSRAELRAMAGKAGMLKERAGKDGVTRFDRIDPTQAPVDHSVAGFYRAAHGKVTAMRQAARGAAWVTQMLMPVDRLIDLALLNTVYKPVHALLPVYTRLQREMQNIQDQIVGDAGRRYEKYEAACKTKAARDNFNSVLRDGTLWGMYPESGRPTWTEAEWGIKPTGPESSWSPAAKEKWESSSAFKTGLSLSQAFTDLNGRYNSMTEAQRTQYHAVINDMEKLRTRYHKSMQDFIKKITAETTLDNATRVDGAVSLVGPDGRKYTAKQNAEGAWELRTHGDHVVRAAPELSQVAAGLAPQGKREAMLQKVDDKFKNIKGPYAPLSRFGSIVVNVYEATTDPTGEVSEDRVARYHFEKESDAQDFLARVRAQDGIRATIEEAAQRNLMRAQVPDEFILEVDAAINRMATDGISDQQRENLAAFGAQLKEDMGRIWLSMTPESSALKHTMKRTGLAGFDEDMMRGYVGYAQRHARGIAYLDRGIAIRETVKEMRAKIAEATGQEEDARASKRLVDRLEDHEAAVRGEKLSDITQKLTRFPFLWYLSSPSVFLVQSSQPFIMTLPKLAVKFGYGKSLTAITRAYAAQANMKDRPFSNERLDAWHQTAALYVDRQLEGVEVESLTRGLSHEELTLLGLAIAVKRGQIDITMTHEAMNILKGNVKGIGDKVTEKAAFLLQLSELMSRKAAFVAAFELEMERHGDFTKAVDNSVEVVRDTLFDYSRANRPEFMLGNAGRLLFQFQIFRVHTLSKMLQLIVSSCTGDNKRAAIKEFSLMMGNLMLTAGVTGLPFLSTVMGAFAFVFGDDDEPWDFDVYMRSVVGDGVVGNALLRGAPTLLGMDISRRVGMSSITDLFSGDPPAGVTGGQLYSYYAGKALGPIGGVASDALFKAPELVKQGKWVEILEQTTPKPIKDLMTGYNTMFGEGKYTGSGELLVDSADMTVWDSVLAMGGINPVKISNAQEQNFNARKLSSAVTARRGELQKQLQRALIGQDPHKIDAAVDDIATFNGKMPQFAITKQQVAAGVKRALRKEMGLEDKTITKVKQKYEIGQGA